METSTVTDTRRRLMQDTVIRYLDRKWWLMNTQAKGWASSAIGPYASPLAIAKEWAVTYGDEGEDEHGDFIAVHAIRSA